MTLSVIDKKRTKQQMSNKCKIALLLLSLVSGLLLFIYAFLHINNTPYIAQISNQGILNKALNNRTDQITQVMSLITNTASPTVIVALTILIALFWILFKRERNRPFILVTAVVVAAGISAVLKETIKNPRPDITSMILPYELDFSFPSGHTICAATLVIILGYLIYSRAFSWIRFTIWIALAATVSLMIAISRLYLGYHWTSDVIASIGLSLIILAAVIAYDLVLNRIRN